MDTIGRFLAVIILTLAVIAGAVVTVRENLIYVFDELRLPPADIPRTEVTALPAFGDDPALTVWKTEPEEGMPVIVYLMGNSGSLSVHEPRLRDLARAGFGIAAMAYRGGGGQEGRPSERTLVRDATRVWSGLDTLYGRELRDVDRVIWGYGLGAGIAAQLAAQQEELAVVLEAPFTRLCEVEGALAAMIPGCLAFRGNEYDTLAHVAEIDAPLLVLYGTADEVVASAQSQAVFDAARAPKFLRVYEGGGHDDLPRRGALDDATGFLKTLRGIR